MVDHHPVKVLVGVSILGFQILLPETPGSVGARRLVGGPAVDIERQRIPSVAATVVRVNAADVPANRRVLVELTGTFPAGLQPMSAEEFQPVVPSTLPH